MQLSNEQVKILRDAAEKVAAKSGLGPYSAAAFVDKIIDAAQEDADDLGDE